MRKKPAARNRIRTLLLMVILATIPCYCAGLIAIQFAPEQTPIPTRTPPVTFTWTPSPTITATFTLAPPATLSTSTATQTS
ncbi:MAG TPA: hypothetical protein VLS48_06290, partial [Anaerolineales bacterium]|nr:hypothetical protein [Anaerolineales bacterium]